MEPRQVTQKKTTAGKPLVVSYGLYQGGSPEAALNLLAAETTGQLSLWEGAGAAPQIVLLQFALPPGGQEIWGHLANSNPALPLLAKNPRATFWVNGPTAYIPSHWAGGERAVPTTYYGWAQFEVTVALTTDATAKLAILDAMLERLQPEGGHPPVDRRDKFWRGMLGAITGLKMRIEGARSRHKYGQNRPPAIRRAIATKLRARAEGRDAEVAAAVLGHLAEGASD